MDLLANSPIAVASFTPAAAYAGWLLKRFGAGVRHESALDPERLGAFLAEGGSFAPSPTLDPHGTSVFITDAPISKAARAAVDAASDAAAVIWLTPWGLDSNWSDRPATALTLQAAGGWMSAVGEPDGEPYGPPDSQAELIAGLFAAIEAVRILGLPEHERPRLVSVPIVEAVAATCIYDVVAFQYYGRVRERASNRYATSQPVIMTMPCKDGYVGIHAALHPQWKTLCQVAGHPDLPSDPRFKGTPERYENRAVLDEEYLVPWLRERNRFEIYHELQRARVPASATPTTLEVLDSPQLAARGFWHETKTAEGGKLRVPGAPARVVFENPPADDHRPAGPWKPGALRVVDVSMGWAGPLVSHILASLGADVIKLESHRRFDWWRGSRPPGDDPNLALHERSHVFNTVNRGKRGLTLDLATPRGRDLALELVSSADVVVENFGAGVLEKLGLTYDVVSAKNPRLIMLRQPGFGSDGPEASYVVFGNTIEGMSGLTAITGPEGGMPYMLSNAFGDPVSGLNGTLAVLSALNARARDGRGRCIEAAQIEGFLPMVSEALIESQITGQSRQRRGNRRPGSEPSGLFRCDGEDAWVAIEVRDDADWQALRKALVEPWADDPRFTTLSGREANRSEIAGRLGEWSAKRTPHEVTELLATAGLPAAPMNHESELLFGEPFASSAFFVGEEREVVGFHLYPTLPIIADGGRAHPSCPAPLLGQHNNEILAGMGLSEAEIDALRDDGVIGERPPVH